MSPSHLVAAAALLAFTPAACADPPPEPRPAPSAAPAPAETPEPPPRQAGPPPPAAEEPRWPEPGAELTPPVPRFPKNFGTHKVFLDAGHGNPGNTGNASCLCIDEQDYNLSMAKHLAPILTATKHFAVRLSRTATPGPAYRKRLAAAARFGAEAIISIHSDVRGEGSQWSPAPGKRCMRNPDDPGFAVLWSDEGPPALTKARHRLARAVATRLAQTGFTPYDGNDYEGLYATDPKTPGVFVDRHQPGYRILFLRRPKIPSIIIETHHAWDPREEARFQEARTRDAFGLALSAGLADFLRDDRPAGGDKSTGR